MPAKRKRIPASSSSSSKKRSKQDDTEFPVREILDEKGNRYLISWAPGADGHEYDPSWEPKENVGWEIIQEWEDKKKRLKEQAEAQAPILKKGIARTLRRTSTVQDTQSPRRPVKRTIDSSSPAQAQGTVPHSSPTSLQLHHQNASPLSNKYGAFTGTRSRSNPDDSVQIQISPLRPSQLDQYEESSYINFPSSQVISGTAPEDTVPPQPSASSADTSKSVKQRSEIPDSQSHNTSLIFQPASGASGAAGGDSTQSNINVNPTQHSTTRLAESTTIPETIVISSGTEQSQASPQIASQSRSHNPPASKPLRRGAHSRDSSVSTSKSSHQSDDSVAAASLARPQLQLGSPFRAATQADRVEEHASSPDFRLPGFDTQSPRIPNASQESKTPRPTTPNGGFLNNVKSRISPFFKPSQVSVIDSTISSLPEPPTQHPDTFASAPARPTTLSTSLVQMATESSLSEVQDSARIQELREAGGPITPAQRSLGMTTRSANRGTSPASLRGARSPSMVPSAEVVPMPTDEENRTSERYPTLYPDQESGDATARTSLASGIMDDASPDVRSNADINNAQDDAYRVEDSHEEHRSPEYAVPIFFLAQQRDHYKNSIVWKKNFIEDFLEQTWPEGSPRLTEAGELVERLHQVISHPDLMNEETFSQVGITPARKAKYDKSQSAKILFLGLLFAELVDQDMHIVIDIAAGRLLGILSEFLTGVGIQHAKAGEPFVGETAFRVTLLPKTTPATGLAKANLVIGFEGAIDLAEDGRKDLRTLPNGVIAPLIYLVVPKSVEHIERHLQEERYAALSPSIRMSILVENLARLRAEAGHAQIQDQDRKNAARSLARYLVEHHKPDEWPLDDLSDLNIINAFSDSQATTESELHSLATTKSAKRHLDEDTNGVAMKKARIDVDISDEMPSTIDPSSLSLSLMSDHMDGQITTASAYATELAAMQQEHQAKELELLKRIAQLENRLQEHISALESLQYRHEDQRKQLVQVSTARDAADERASNVANQMSSRENLLSKVKAEREDYKIRLAAAEAALASHTIPEIAEFEALKSTAAAAEKEKAKLELRVKNLSNDLEYIRNMYQDVSGKGSAVIEERNELASQVADLEKQASTQRATALRLTADNTHKQLGNEIKHLRATLAEREAVLAKREDEITKLREKERGRMSTRGGSVPRSPGRLGSPMRLEPPRMGSRAGSPMSKSRLGR